MQLATFAATISLIIPTFEIYDGIIAFEVIFCKTSFGFLTVRLAFSGGSFLYHLKIFDTLMSIKRRFLAMPLKKIFLYKFGSICLRIVGLITRALNQVAVKKNCKNGKKRETRLRLN